MQRMNSALKTVLWYSKRPRLYPELMRAVRAKYARRAYAPDTRAEATCWCNEGALTTAEAIAEITGMTAFEPVRDRFRDIFARAEEIVQRCPVKMGGASNLDLLFWICEHLRATNVIETGVAYGWSSLAILLSLQNRDDAILVSTDMPYLKRNNDAHVGCVVPEQLRPKWQILACADREALPKALKMLPSIDMCHYDSDKSYAGRTWAYPLLWAALRPGGIFISDDIGDNLAFHDFCSRTGQDPVIVCTLCDIGTKHAGVLVKTSDEG